MSTDLHINVNLNLKWYDWYTSEESIFVTYEYIMILIKLGNLWSSLIHSDPCDWCFINTQLLYKQTISEKLNTTSVKFLKNLCEPDIETWMKMAVLWYNNSNIIKCGIEIDQPFPQIRFRRKNMAKRDPNDTSLSFKCYIQNLFVGNI